jgi:cyanate permease
MSLGVLSALAVIWSGVETWSSCRRSGHVGIDYITLGKLIVFACGNLANVFFFVVACASFHTFIFYKGQSVVQVLLPSHIQDQLVKSYVISSFCLKVSNDEG